MLQQDHLTVKSELKLLNQVQKWFEQFCFQYLYQFGWSEIQVYRLNLALAEGFTNAVRHAHHGLPPDTTIDIEVSLWTDRLEIRVWDRGEPFNPDAIAEPKPGTLQAGGYGWFLLRRLSDHVEYERVDGDTLQGNRPRGERNCLLIVKYLCPLQD
jgi:serine/threonine-protein kinase RsbW